ncbi:nucleotidyltransferase family protein [Geobacter sulfurreducens]|uniref:nucleotidyltransferase family protein n=1 Tax=Geobacter sulfurreducens TaxID=35554 RepID=UPI0001D8F2FF|nr:nucleotidyltransferase family protein [Geobacter sulfurreducens]ADI84803.1 nucleotidyltransferase, CBS domain pair and CBS domain pair-containing [Geobacter sulfurreducens KN400]
MTSDIKAILEQVVISPDVPIAEAIAQLDRAGTGSLVVCSADKKLYGLLTDGDVRRALLKAVDMGAPCGDIANRKPVITFVPLLPIEALRLMNHHDINHLPVLDAEGRVVDFLLRRDLVAEDELAARARRRLDSVVIPCSASIAEAITQLDRAGTGALVLCSEGDRLHGLLTDGDIRRAVLRGISLDAPCQDVASRRPVTVEPSFSAAQALHLMNQHDINHLPVVDDTGRVVDFLLRRDLIADDQLNLSAVVMAGGYGKRLLPLTEQVPKPMLPVGDRPLLERTIDQLRRSGIREVNLTTHYLPDSIVEHFGDGDSFGVKLNYLKEDHPLGTAGGLKLMKKASDPFLVMNGDILTGVPFQEMFAYHRKNGAEITVGVRKYEVQVPFGVVECDDVRITGLKEKPSLTFFINAGIYLLEPSVCDLIPEGERFDMTDLIQKLLDEGRSVVSFPIMEYWLDVGRHEDYQKAQEDVRNGKIQ